MMQRVLALVLGVGVVVWTVYNFVYQSPTEILAANFRARVAQGMGHCSQSTQPITLWYDKPDGVAFIMFKPDTRVVRLGETWDSWPYPDQWVKVGIDGSDWTTLHVGWVDDRDLIPCTAAR